MTNDLYEFDPAGPAWRTCDPGSSGLVFFPVGLDPADSLDGDGANEGGVLRPKARARLGMVGGAGGLYVFGGRGARTMAGTMRNGALEGRGAAGWGWERLGRGPESVARARCAQDQGTRRAQERRRVCKGTKMCEMTLDSRKKGAYASS